MSVVGLNDIVTESIIGLDFYNSTTHEMMWQANQLANATLDVTANEQEVTDAMGVPIATFFRGRSGTLSATNALFSLPVAAAQSGNANGLVRGTSSAKINVPITQTFVTSQSQSTIQLDDVPTGTEDAEIPFIYAMDGTGYKTRSYSLGATATADNFTLDAASKTITLPTGLAAGTRIMVPYNADRADALRFSATGNDSPRAGIAHLRLKCHNLCDVSSIVYGVMVCPNAQLSGNYQFDFASDGQHAIELRLMQDYCDPDKLLYHFYMY